MAWVEPPPALVDVGSGVGLPGIPLAIAYPEIAVTLLDRSQRRSDLARRAVHILGLTNVDVARDDARSHPDRYAAATFRASLKPGDAIRIAPALLQAGGVAVIGLHRGRDPGLLPKGPSGAEFRILETPEGILDSPAWHLRMTLR